MQNSALLQTESPERKFLDILDKSQYCDLLPLSDGTIYTDDGCTFKIHRVTLASNSEYFKILFLGRNNLRSEVSVPGIAGDCMSNILIYLYTRQVRVTENNVSDLLVGSDYLMLTDLYTIVKNSINACLTDYNCFRLLHAAYLIRDDFIFQKCFRYIQIKFQDVCCQKDDLVELPQEVLWKLLRCRSLYVDSESTVWQVIVDWTEEDISNRLNHVHHLLLSLASGEIGEDLATEILNHAIVSANARINTAKTNTSFKNIPNNLALLRTVMSELEDDNTKLYSFRVPPRFYIILVPSLSSDFWSTPQIVNLYLSYDESIDLWQKITETDVWPDYMIENNKRIYVFESYEKICRYFRLDIMEWVPIEGFRNSYNHYTVLAISKYIYILGTAFIDLGGCEYKIEVLDTESSLWTNVVAPLNILNGKAVTACGRIYVLKDDIYTDMSFQVFDPETQHWSLLPIPKIHRKGFYALSYHQKIYILGGYDIHSFISKPEVFDPNTNTWSDLIDLPYEFCFFRAVIFEDKILVYDENESCNISSLLWNEETERWEEVKTKFPLLKTPDLIYCTTEDVETKKLIKGQKRDPKLSLDDVLPN